MNKVLVTGGAGFIGSHMIRQLRDRQQPHAVIDNLSNGHLDAVFSSEFFRGDISDERLLDEILEKGEYDSVIHFASDIQVGESTIRPDKYFLNNIAGTIQLLNAIVRHRVSNFIFSSSAAVYGEPRYTPIDEDHPQTPLSPYGRSKLVVEQLLQDYAKAFGLRYVSFRYFNAAGAQPDGTLGERHEPETHLIPLAVRAALGKIPELKLYGSNYETPDGTCIRDFVHVVDIAEAHLLGLDYLRRHGVSDSFNIGSESGFSVRQVIEMVEKVSGKKVPLALEPRREGDPAVLLADANKARNVLGWSPKLSGLEEIVRHCLDWELRRV